MTRTNMSCPASLAIDEHQQFMLAVAIHELVEHRLDEFFGAGRINTRCVPLEVLDDG